MNIRDFLLQQKNSNKIAIKCGEEQITYKALHNRCEIISSFLLKHFSKSDNIIIFLPNSIDFVVAYFSIIYAGKTAVPLGSSSKEPEIDYCIKQCNSKLIITNSNQIKNTGKLKGEINILYIDEFKDDIVKEIIQTSKYNKTVVMLSTSGTTSKPKKVMLSDENIYFNIIGLLELLPLKENDIPLVVLPFSFSYGHTAQMLLYIYLGLTFVIMDSFFMVNSFLNLINKESITYFEAVPSLLIMILKYAKNDMLNNIWSIGFVGDKISNYVMDKLIDKYPHIKFLQVYGQTEASPIITKLEINKYLEKRYSVGKPISGVKIKIVKDGINCFPNVIGDIFVSGPNIMKGYYQNPEETEKKIINGYLDTGDLGWFDEDGYLYIKGRKDNLIISGGMNISPEEVEEVIRMHPAVEEACAFPEQDEILGKAVSVRVVYSESVSENELINFCSERLSSYKVPRRITFVDYLPKTESGKYKKQKNEER